jgi:hypothetical protein
MTLAWSFFPASREECRAQARRRERKWRAGEGRAEWIGHLIRKKVKTGTDVI